MHTLSAATPLLVGLALVLLAPTAQADCPHNNKFDHPHCDGVAPSPSDQNVYVTMSLDQEVTLATSGPLEVFATCSVVGTGGIIGVEVFVTSTARPSGRGPTPREGMNAEGAGAL